MLKVLIADDEEKVCQLIRGLIPWEELGFAVVGMAGDGLTALSMAREQRPDILITDIRMPGLDGIQLIGAAKEELPALRCIIISGYRHFDYAHNAIKFGVEDYLLKPLQKKELISTLEKLKTLKAHAEEDTPRPLLGALFSDCLSGGIGAAELTPENVLERYRVQLPESGPYYALITKADLASVEAGGNVRRIASERIAESLRQALSPHVASLQLALLPEGIAALFVMPPEGESAMIEALHAVRDSAELMRDLFPTLRVSMGLSRPAKKLSDAAGVFAQAYTALEKRLSHGEGALFFGRPAPFVALSLKGILRGETQRQLATALQAMQAGAYERALRDSVGQLAGAAGENYPQLRALLLEMVRLHFEHLPGVTSLKDIEDMAARLTEKWNAAYDMAQVEEGLVSLLSGHLEGLLREQKQVEQLPLRRAKAYIRENFHRQITLEEVSGVAGFNPAYFSTLFKKETGERFLEYLASVRVAAAKQLLTDSGKAVAVVAEETGYGDVKYFCKQFKKATGLSPQEYRKMYG